MPESEVTIIATISTSLRMFDQMTRPLQQVTQALNLTISAMDNMNNSANRDMRITNTLNTARESISRASAGLQELAREQDRARNSQDSLNNSFNRGANSADSLTSKIKGLVGGYLGFQTAKRGLDATIGGAARLERQLITISGMLGNKDVGRSFFKQINDYALISQYGLKDFAAISRQFIQFTKNTDKLMDLNKLAERLAFLDPTQGLEGAGFALKEILGGDGMSLKGRFGFGAAEIKQLKEASNMDDFMKKFDEMLNKKGGTQLAVEEAAGAAISLWDNLIANISTSFSKAGNNALEAIKPLLKTLNEGFKAGNFQPFFDGVSLGLSVIINIMLGVAYVISFIGGVVKNNWSIIEPILIATIIYLAYILIPILWNAITTVAAMAVAWMMVNWPIMLVIGTMAIFIYILNACGVTAGQIIGFIGGIFGILFGFLYNGVATIWNTFASLAEFLANVFNHPLYSTKKLFFDIWNSIVKFVGGALDSIVGLIKKVPFLRDLVGDFSFVNTFSADAGKPPEDYWEAPKMEMKDYANEFKYGYGKGTNIANNIGNALGGLNDPLNKGIQDQNSLLDDWNTNQKDGFGSTDDKLGKIKDSIDVSNEHLELMRDLAEQESIQNFVTLTPTVQVTTGDIKEEADINKIISKIENYMENELANSAEGVYA
ncbi:MAG: hypothetical protein AB2417_02555 [Clostridiaceae bacterium]